jgi:hypothetical protein
VWLAAGEARLVRLSAGGDLTPEPTPPECPLSD